jgi:hypothetical protein
MFAGLLAAGCSILAQQPEGQGGGGRGQFAGMQRVNGEVTAVSATGLTLKTEDGSTVQVTTTDNTRVMKGSATPGAGPGGGMGARGAQVKLSDVKVGDGVMAAGNLDAPNKTLHALMIMATDAATVKALKDNLGKTYITGKVTAIDVDNAKMTVERPDKVSQVIGFDETTSFKRGRPGRMGGGNAGGAGAVPPAEAGESITLADIKVGDNITGQGSVKSGTFVPAQLTISTPGTGGPRRGGQGAQPPATPNSAGPGSK